MSVTVNEAVKVEFDVYAKNVEVAFKKFQIASQKTAEKMSKAFVNAAKKIGTYLKRMAIAGAAAFVKMAYEGAKYTKSLEDARAMLEAMVKSQRGYTDSVGNALSAQERQAMVNIEVAATFKEINAILPDTAMQLDGLVKNYALMKPAMDDLNVPMEKQVNLLKLISNAATNFGLSADSLSQGIDDLGRGTWIVNGAFGKMLKSLRITKEEFKAAGDKVAYLEGKLAEAGQMADTMEVAMSNLTESWSVFTAKIVGPYWDQLKDNVKKVTQLLGHNGDVADWMGDVFRQVVNGMIEASGMVAKAVFGIGDAIVIIVNAFKKLWHTALAVVGKVKALWNGTNKETEASLNKQIKSQKVLYDYNVKMGRNTKNQVKLMNELGGALADVSKTNMHINAANKANDAMFGGFDNIMNRSVKIDKVVKSMKLVKPTMEEATASSKKFAESQKVVTEATDKAKKAAKKLTGAKKAGVKASKAVKEALSAESERLKQTYADYQEALQKTNDYFNQIGATIEQGIGDALLDAAQGAKNFGDIMRGVLNDIARQIMASGIAKLFGSDKGGGAGSGIGGWLKDLFSANASGGIVNSPTMVGMQGSKMAVAGEAGAEAIIPLQKRNGVMGVAASPVTVNVQNYSGQPVEVQQQGDSYEVIVGRLAQDIKRGTGNIGNVLESRYGMRKA